MFYARCARRAIEVRRLECCDRFNFFLQFLNDPIPAMDDWAKDCLLGDDAGLPLFPVGQISRPAWVYNDLPY